MVQGSKAAVELYDDEVGGLYIFREEDERGFYMAGEVPGALFENDAREIAGGYTATWRLDLPRTTRDQAQRVGAVHVASWEDGEVTVHRDPSPKARMYLGLG